VNYQAFLAGVFAMAMASMPAYAQPGGRDPSWRAERQQQREFRRDENMQQRRHERMAGPEERHGRLSPEERQQLRRDIREHGRDVYRDRPRRF
jgi:hemolysin activation/secretion protein